MPAPYQSNFYRPSALPNPPHLLLKYLLKYHSAKGIFVEEYGMIQNCSHIVCCCEVLCYCVETSRWRRSFLAALKQHLL